MTDTNIIHALQCCGVETNCRNCPLYEERSADCIYTVLRNALDLITRQQAEIERLQKEVNLVSIQFQDIQEHYEEAQAKIESLKQRNTVCEAANRCIVWQRDRRDREIEELHSQIAGLNIYKSKIKAEAYKEFAERLKKEISAYRRKCRDTGDDEGVFAVDKVRQKIDNIEKEMVGENNE